MGFQFHITHTYMYMQYIEFDTKENQYYLITTVTYLLIYIYIRAIEKANKTY